VFTGIVEAIGQIEAVRAGREASRLRVAGPAGFGPLELGESVAVNGVCLTVERADGAAFEADVSAETLSRTTLGRMRAAASVNLERALALGGRLGGHLVTGHIDAVGAIRSLVPRGDSWELSVDAPAPVLDLCVEKGSVAVDGLSLTVAGLDERGFRCAIVPHTFRSTTLRRLGPGDPVNLEADLIGKYVKRLLGLESGGPPRITWDTLRRHGYA